MLEVLEVPEVLEVLDFLGNLDFLEKPDYCWLMGRMPLQRG